MFNYIFWSGTQLEVRRVKHVQKIKNLIKYQSKKYLLTFEVFTEFSRKNCSWILTEVKNTNVCMVCILF